MRNPPRYAEIFAIGSELLDDAHLDTNSLFLSRELATLGISLLRKAVLPDDPAVIASALATSLRRVPLVVCCGGLGPTADDRTREAAARALHCGLHRDPRVVARLRRRFRRYGRAMPANNLQQADRLACAEWLPNPRGSAPGQWCRSPGGWLVLLPGPPAEMQAMFVRHVRPRLRALGASAVCFTRVLSLFGLPESEVDARVAPLYTRVQNPSTTILATSAPAIELRFRATAGSAAAARRFADGLAREAAAVLGEHVFSRDQESLAAVVGRLLAACSETVAVAESCTGGLLGSWLSAVPGASEYFLGGAISYSNALKRTLLGVPPRVLRVHGAVSAACARAMAEGVARRCAADWGVAITGIAGPTGGTSAKPVGTVFVALARRGEPGVVVPLALRGDRDTIRRFSAQWALHHLRLRLLR